jgi:glycine dehydrogenase subunit 1
MLGALGITRIDALFDVIPSETRLDQPPPLPPALDERALLDHLEALAERNDRRVPFLGAGAYPHHVPPAVDQLLLRSEFYTAYTPYQPEVSQGTLQAIFEFQTFVALLTGLDVANSSMYDAATATVEAALLACRAHPDRRAVAVARSLSPFCRAVLKTYLEPLDIELRELPFDPMTGQLDLDAAAPRLIGAAALVAGYPNFLGIVEPFDAIAALAHDAGALAISVTEEAVALGMLASPGALGADLSAGSMQSFGSPLNFGGPGLGFLAARQALVRQLPGRLVGATVDRQGRRGFALTLATREQHIRREKATSNICSNHGLCALAATIHLALLGAPGLAALAKLNYQRARHAREALRAVGLAPLFTGPVFNEFALRADPDEIQTKLEQAGLNGGYGLRRDDLNLDGVLFCVTELHSPQDIGALVQALHR